MWSYCVICFVLDCWLGTLPNRFSSLTTTFHTKTQSNGSVQTDSDLPKVLRKWVSEWMSADRYDGFASFPAGQQRIWRRGPSPINFIAKTSRRYLYGHTCPAIWEVYVIINILNGENDGTSDGWQQKEFINLVFMWNNTQFRIILYIIYMYGISMLTRDENNNVPTYTI
jgi:hypothetical protein